MMANQSAPGLNRGLPSNLWGPKLQIMKFTEECVICMEMHVLIKQMFRLNLS